jgi:hypothetical protein
MSNNLTVLQSIGYLDDEDRGSRTIRGRRTVFLDGGWIDQTKSKLPPDLRVLVHTITSVYQVWLHGELIEEIVKGPGVTLPDPEERNKKIPETEWDDGYNGKRPPASVSRLIYMVAPDGEEFTFISSTVGANIAVSELKEKIRNVRQWRNDPYLCAIIGFGTKPMPTRFSPVPKPRPFFEIHDYRSFGKPMPAAPEPPALDHSAAEQPTPPTVEEPSLAEKMGGDEVPPFDDPLDINVPKAASPPVQHNPPAPKPTMTKSGVQKIAGARR